MKKTIQQFTQRLGNVRKVSNPDALAQHIADLEESAAAPAFWKDPASAEEVLSELKTVRDDAQVIAEMESLLEDIRFGYEMLSETEMTEEELIPFQVVDCSHFRLVKLMNNRKR